MAIKFYSGPLSLFSHKIEIAMREKRLAFDRVMVPFSQGKGYHPKHPDVLKANPKGQVPVLIDNGLTLFDSTLILEYLEDAHPDPALYPKDAKDRARCRLVELTADEILLPKVARLMYRTEPADPDPARQRMREEDGTRAEGEIREMYGAFEDRLKGRDYFCGAFTVADIAMFMTLLFARRLGAPSLSDHARLDGWYGRTLARPAVAMVAGEVAEADRVLSPA